MRTELFALAGVVAGAAGAVGWVVGGGNDCEGAGGLTSVLADAAGAFSSQSILCVRLKSNCALLSERRGGCAAVINLRRSGRSDEVAKRS